MDKKLPVEEFSKMEDILLDRSKTLEVKYSVDLKMEALVRYDLLKELYGQESVDKFIEDKGRTIDDLNDPDFFESVKKLKIK